MLLELFGNLVSSGAEGLVGGAADLASGAADLASGTEGLAGDGLASGFGDAMGGMAQNIGDNFAENLSDISTFVDNPLQGVTNAITGTDLFSLAQNPAKYAKDQIAKISDEETKRVRKRRPMGIPEIAELDPISALQGGFINQSPQYLNTDQLILRRM